MLIALLAVALQTTTTCQPLGQSVTCQSNNWQQQIPDYGAVARSGQLSVPAYQPGPPIDFDRIRRQRLRSSVGKMISMGDCPSAINLALSKGDMDLAREAKDFCGK